jgi:hypothetical protein
VTLSNHVTGALLDAQHCDKRKLMAKTKKDPAAVSLGRRGGKEYARAHTAEERKAQAQKAAQARWAKVKAKRDRAARKVGLF